MSDSGRQDETEPTRSGQPGRTDDDREAATVDADPAPDESPADDASAAAERFAREEGEAPSG